MSWDLIRWVVIGYGPMDYTPYKYIYIYIDLSGYNSF